jgi:hypothetical protein
MQTTGGRELLEYMLIERGVAEEKRGYGHATAEEVADVVMEWLAIEQGAK